MKDRVFELLRETFHSQSILFLNKWQAEQTANYIVNLKNGGHYTDELEILYIRLQKIGIHIELISNAPWIYLYKVNGNLVQEEDWNANYGFTIAWNNHWIRLNDLKQIFRIIRKYR